MSDFTLQKEERGETPPPAPLPYRERRRGSGWYAVHPTHENRLRHLLVRGIASSRIRPANNSRPRPPTRPTARRVPLSPLAGKYDPK